MDSFIEAQNNLERTNFTGCVTLLKTRQSPAVRFSFMPMVMKSPRLKTYRGPKRKEQLGACSLPGFYVPEVVGREFCLGAPDYSVVINNTLAIERRGGRGAEKTPMLVRSVGRDQRPWNKGLLIGQKGPLEPKHVWSIRVRLEIARSWRDLVIFNLAIDSKLRACDPVKLRLDDIAQEQWCGIGQRSLKRRQVDQSSSRSRSSRGVPLKPGYQCSGPLAPDISSQVDFMQASHIHPPICPVGASLGGSVCIASGSTSQPPWQARNSASRKSTPAFGLQASCTMIPDPSTRSRKPCNLSTTRSARGCHSCPRYDLLPMSPGCTIEEVAEREGEGPRNPVRSEIRELASSNFPDISICR